MAETHKVDTSSLRKRHTDTISARWCQYYFLLNCSLVYDIISGRPLWPIITLLKHKRMFYTFIPWHQMEVTGQFHAPAAQSVSSYLTGPINYTSGLTGLPHFGSGAATTPRKTYGTAWGVPQVCAWGTGRPEGQSLCSPSNEYQRWS
jgi:hypothetical protein